MQCVTTDLYKSGLNWKLCPLSSEVKDNRRPYDLDYSCLGERKLTNAAISRQTAGLILFLLLLLPFTVYPLPRLSSHGLQTASQLFSSHPICSPSPHSPCPLLPNIFKYCLAFDYQMEGDFSRTATITLHKR